MMVGVAAAATPPLLAFACGGAIERQARPTSDESSTTEGADGALGSSTANRNDGGASDASRDSQGQPDDGSDPISPLPDGSLADGVCTHPTGHPDLFDPDCIYAVGVFYEGTGPSLFFELDHPNDHRGGVWPYGMARIFVRPSDNRLVYGGAGLRMFEADPFVGGTYPSDMAAAANDPVLSAPACPTSATLVGIFPDDDVALYHCEFGMTYLEGSSAPVIGLERGADALGPNRTALVLRGSNGPKIWSNGVDVPLSEWPTGLTPIAARYADGTFMVATTEGATPERLQRWAIGTDGVAAQVGNYLNPQNLVTGYGSALDPAGNLYRVSWVGLDDRIVRFSVKSAPVVVYDEQYPDGGKKPVRLHGASLFTGP